MIFKLNKLSIGDKFNGFKYLRKFSVPEFKLNVHEFKHQTATTKYYHFDRNDDNKAFNIIFNTTPYSNSGVSHILEHTVLCGSKKFPIRDPFFNMLRRSQSNFMNALTGYDYTCYPFSTFNDVDYFNLLSVYLDAVFDPILRETDFMQEGWRLEPQDFPKDPNSKLEIKGVVYNEMKGVFSNSSNLFMYKVMNELLPKTYGFISGGDPKDITTLSWNDLKSYYKKYYSPRNATLLTYGNLDLDKFTDYVNKNYFSNNVENFEYEPAAAEPHWKEPREITFYCSPDSNTPFKDRDCSISVSYKIASSEDVYLSLKMNILSGLLTDGENAPLYRELISENQLGLNWSIKGFDNSSRTTSFHIGIEGVREADLELIKDKINHVLSRFSQENFPSERVEALLHAYEMAIKTDSVKFGLRTLLACSSSIVHKQDLKDVVSIQKFLDQLRQEYSENPSLFSQMIKDYFINNQHKLVTIMKADPNYAVKQMESEKNQLEKLIKNLQEEDKKVIIEKCEKLSKNQSTKEDVSILPCLTIADIPKTTSKELFHLTRENDFEYQMNEHDTNGIVYTKILFDLNHLPEHLIPYLSLFSEILTKIGMQSISHLDFAMKEELFTSGIGNKSGIFPTILANGLDNLEDPNLYLYISSACLERNIANFMNLLEIILSQDLKWNETTRISQLISMYAQSAWSSNSLAHSGHSVAMDKAYASMNRTASLSDSLSGISHGETVISLIKKGPGSMSETIEKLREIHKLVFFKNNARISLTGAKKSIDESRQHLTKLMTSLTSKDSSSINKVQSQASSPLNFYYAMPYQVHYVSKAIKTVCQFHEFYPKLAVLARLISSKFLHSEIREKGGAYGGGCVLRSGSLTFYSYRDPNFMATLEAFNQSITWATRQDFNDQDLLEAKLSIFNGYDQPVDKKSMGNRYFFSRVTDDLLDRRRQILFNVTLDDVYEAANYLKTIEDMSVCTLGPKDSITSEMKNDQRWMVKETL